MSNLNKYFDEIMNVHEIPVGDMPSVSTYEKFLKQNSLSNLNIKNISLEKIDLVINEDMQALEKQILDLESKNNSNIRGSTADFSQLNKYIPFKN